MIACPKCHSGTDARETRTIGDYVRRRRVCSRCGERVTTVEIVVGDGNRGFHGAKIIPQRDIEALQRIVDRATGKLIEVELP